jgi:serine/threonine protein kinase
MTVFLTCYRKRLGFVSFFPLDLFTPESPLGRGSTSLCLSVKCNGTVVALKISRDSGALQTERTILQYLNSSCQSLAISSISDLQQSMLQSPSLSSHCNMLTQVFSPFTMKTLKISHLRSKWEILKVVHSLGVCHRDVRVSNIGYCQPDSNHKVVYLMD